MSYVVGIDLGTTSTVAAVCRPGGAAQVVPLEGSAGAVPSAVYLGADGTFLVGEAALRRALSDPGHVVRDLTRRVGDATPVLVGRRPVSPDELAARFLAKLVDDVARREGGVAARVAVTHPASFGPHRMGALHAALAEQGLGSAMLVAGAGGRGDRVRRRRAGRARRDRRLSTTWAAAGATRRCCAASATGSRSWARPRASRASAVPTSTRWCWRTCARRSAPRGRSSTRPTRTCSPRWPTCAARSPPRRRRCRTTPRCSCRSRCRGCARRCGWGARSSRR